MKALATSTRTALNKKAKITYISSFKKRNKVKPYVKFDLDWQDILRANDPEKRLSEASVMLSARLAYELHKNNERSVFLTSHWFEKTTKKKRHQNRRLRGQIDHIFHFKFHPRKFNDGEMLYNVYEVWYTLDSQKILNLEDVKIEEDSTPKPQKNKLQACSTNAPGVEHKSYSYIEDKEIIKPLKRVLFISDNEKLKIKRKTIEEEITSEKSIEQTQPLEKSSLDDDFEATTGDEVGNDHQEATEAKSVVEVVKGAFKHCELLPPTPSQQTTETTEINQMAKSDRYGKHREQQSQQDLKQALNHEIQKCFNVQQSVELQESLEIRTLAPDKVGLKFKIKIDLNENNKARLRECIRTVYGHTTNIVMMPKWQVVKAIAKPEILNKPEMPTAEESARRGVRYQESDQLKKWNIVKQHLKKTYGNDLVRVILQKLMILEQENKIIFKGTNTFTEMMEEKFTASLRWASAEYGLHFVFEGKCRALNQVLTSEIKEEKRK